MRPTAYLLNAARGALVDEPALVTALAEGWIAGAGVDAFAEEPLSAEHPLRRLPNCLASPHSAFNTVEVAAATNVAVADAILADFRGDRPTHTVNPAVYDTSAYQQRRNS
jgi:phosphoglycerate dehydrogenase-like enzyme